MISYLTSLNFSETAQAPENNGPMGKGAMGCLPWLSSSMPVLPLCKGTQVSNHGHILERGETNIFVFVSVR